MFLIPKTSLKLNFKYFHIQANNSLNENIFVIIIIHFTKKVNTKL